MKNLKKATEIPVTVTIALAATLATVILLLLSGNADFASISALVLLGTGVGLQMHYGSIVIKRVMSVFIVLYITSYYTFFVTNIFGYVTQPFLLTLAGITAFLASTYDKSHIYDLRSRKLWGTVLSVLLVAIKLTTILMGFSFIVAEFIGLNIVIIYTILWRIWVRSYKKTRVVLPKVNDTKDDEKYHFIYIDNKLNVEKNNWMGINFHDSRNSYPYVYTEVMKAKDDGKTLIIVSEKDTSQTYDYGEIKLNKAKTVPYLYMEAEDKRYMNEIIKDFENEVMKH